MFAPDPADFKFDRCARFQKHIQRFNRRQMIPTEAKVLWQIEAGFVRTLTSDEDGTLTTLGFWKNGDIVGLPLTDIRPYWVECLTSVKATRLLSKVSQPRDALVSQMQFFQSQQSQELLRIAHCKRVEFRLLKLLNWLAQLIGEKLEEGYFIPLRLTHQDLADTVGTTRVTVTRLINEFQRSGRIRDTHHGYFLKEG
ncbi:MAG: Crp/Fnr family transcriptional regulator [Geitlerinemataceae cyanobacterium]